MRHCMLSLISALVVGILGIAIPAPAYYETDTYKLERTYISGFVVVVDDQIAYIQTDDGYDVSVVLGPESYWSEQGYYLPQGEYVEMEVWYDPTDRYTDWYFAGEIWGPDFHFVLTNNEGVPYWVIFADDYYYSLGYRASCVSYMVWYDCPPIYFVYLILPPPPPPIYICYYGPRWHHHHHDWHHGPRYCQGGSYWRDGQGYERPSHRSGRRARSYDRWGDGTGGSDRPQKANDAYRRSSPSTPPPAVKPQPRKDDYRKAPAKPERAYDRKSVTLRSETYKRNVASRPPAERKLYVPKSEPPKRQIQDRSKERSKPDVRASNTIRREPPREKIKPQDKQQYRAPQSKNSESRRVEQYRAPKSDRGESAPRLRGDQRRSRR